MKSILQILFILSKPMATVRLGEVLTPVERGKSRSPARPTAKSA